MKNTTLILLLHISITVYLQNRDSIINYNCNDKWLDEIVKSDSISKKNRSQDYECYLYIFDSLQTSKTYSKFQILHAIGNLSKYSDGAFSEELFYAAFEYLFSNAESFFTNLKKENKAGMKNWAMMIYYEYAQRSASEMNFSNYIIEELKKIIKNKNLKSWELFQKVLKEVDLEHQKMLEEYNKNQN